ncbi:hypothetical protein HH214_19040 [Mucilaginibacter robiniae]|uniref:DUF4412 domain-containing protein n=1 Tax=Mucilaginibacter robiniae TaxID=2728022 RepID=A0A7L5E3C7_9SPHI|nr:DUF4412 domain-containing protein [Mucilaginibacter robiniae]QJD97822.1 hypothetical protein HH214_19040 [Mucilaginibacter robiniae]
MNFKFLSVALGMALSATAISASAQKKYTEGMATFEANANGQPLELKTYFKGDSTSTSLQQGPASIKYIAYKDSYLAVLVDVSAFGIKKAGVATPSELEDFYAALPTLTFTPTTETKQINGFNCKKVIAKDAKNNASYDVWVTNDFEAPVGLSSNIYAKVGGFPVQFTVFQQGKKLVNTLKTITETKTPAGTFNIPAGFDRITLTELSALSGGK